MLRQTRAQLADAPVEVPRLHDLAEKAGRQPLLGGEVLRQQQYSLGARSPERGDQPRVVGKRQAIAERARDRNAEARAGGRDAKVARPPPMANPSITASVGTGSASMPPRMPSIFSS